MIDDMSKSSPPRWVFLGPVRRLDFKYTLLHLQDGNIESPTTKIIDCDGGYFAKDIRKGGGCRFVNNTKDFETDNLASIFGCMMLCIIEIDWDGDDGVPN